MKHFYSEVNSITLTNSDIKNDNGVQTMRFRFDRDHKHKESDFAEGSIPQYSFDKAFGFSEAELNDLMRYIRNNALLMWRIALEDDK